MEESQYLVDKWLLFSRLLHDKMSPALLSYLDERVACHVLNTWKCHCKCSQRHKTICDHKLLTLMSLMHELKQLIDDCLEEFPVCLQEARILADDVHDIRGNDSFVVFASFDFAQSQEILDDSNKEAFFGLLVCRLVVCQSRSN